MLLFQKRFLAGIVDGTVTLTFRGWAKPLVKAGGRYRVHPIGVVVVVSIAETTLPAISKRDARKAGFASLEELREYISSAPARRDDGVLYGVEFHHDGEEDRVAIALDEVISADEAEVIRRKLRALDERSPKAWTRKTLDLIAANPRIAASKLAPKLKMEKIDFKAKVVKLKKLGLTTSFETGYEISPRGKSFLKMRNEE